MNARRIRSVIQRHFFETLGNPDRIADMLLWPFLDVITWGFFSRYLVRGGHASFVAPEQLIGGIVLWGAFRAFQRDLAVGFLADIWPHNIAGLFATPLSFGEYQAGLFSVNLIKAGLILGLICGACKLFTSLPGLLLVVQLLAPLGILLGFGAAIGLFVTGLILRFTTRLQTLAYGLAGLLMPLSCVFYPAAALPPVLRRIAVTLPTTQAFEAMRLCMQGQPCMGALVRGGVGTLLSLCAAAIFFRAILRGTRRNGRLIRLD